MPTPTQASVERQAHLRCMARCSRARDVLPRSGNELGQIGSSSGLMTSCHAKVTFRNWQFTMFNGIWWQRQTSSGVRSHS